MATNADNFLALDGLKGQCHKLHNYVLHFERNLRTLGELFKFEFDKFKMASISGAGRGVSTRGI